MMGIVVPETCWASNKICNKNLLHLVGIIFPNTDINILEYNAVPTGMAEHVFGPENAIKFLWTVGKYWTIDMESPRRRFESSSVSPWVHNIPYGKYTNLQFSVTY